VRVFFILISFPQIITATSCECEVAVIFSFYITHSLVALEELPEFATSEAVQAASLRPQLGALQHQQKKLVA
jgi:hypothetical protein